MRPTGQETTNIEKTVDHSQFPRGGGTAHHAGLHGEAPGSVRRQRDRGKPDKSLYCDFCRKEQVRQG